MTHKQVTTETLVDTIFPVKTRIRLALVWAVVLAFYLWGNNFLGANLNLLTAAVLFGLLLFTIIAAAFGVVKEADELAHKLGEPYGTLILTLSIVSIEVILIAAVMLGPGEMATIGKDSIFSVMMIILNLVMGICLLAGGLKYGDQAYNAQGTLTYMAMIIMLGGIALMLPNFIQGAGNGIFTSTQAVFIAGSVVVLYAFFLFFQTTKYSYLFIQPKSGAMEISYAERLADLKNVRNSKQLSHSGQKKEIWLRSLILVAMILPIVLLSHNMAVVVDYGIATAQLPLQLGGILIAVIVFTPESMTAVKATLNNELQRTINLSHGAFVSTVGLTVPAVLAIGLISGKTVQLGLSPTETLLFMVTLVLSMITFMGKRTSPFLGIMHLLLFVLFIVLVFNP